MAEGALRSPWGRGNAKSTHVELKATGHRIRSQQHVPEPWDLSLRLGPVSRSPRATRVPKAKNEATRTDHPRVEMTSCSGCPSLQGDIERRFEGAEEDSKDHSPLSSMDFTTKKPQERAPAPVHLNPVLGFISLPPASYSVFQCGDRELAQQSLKIHNVFGYGMVPSCASTCMRGTKKF